MHYKALLTRVYSMADESLQIIIEDTDSFDTFKTRVYTALKVADHRANTQMMRLFEDTDLTKELDYHELQACRKAAETLYPQEHFSKSLDLGAGSAFEFAKNMASGEVVKIFLHDVESYEDLNTAIKNVWNIIDSRLEQTNGRELAFMKYVKSLAFSVKLKITKVMEILYGRMLKEVIVEQLKGERLQREEEANVSQG